MTRSRLRTNIAYAWYFAVVAVAFAFCSRFAAAADATTRVRDFKLYVAAEINDKWRI